VKFEELGAAMAKYRASPYFTGDSGAGQQKSRGEGAANAHQEYKKVSDQIESISGIPVDEILYFCSQEKATFAILATSKTCLFDHTRTTGSIAGSTQSFRTNRKYIISVSMT
jgi:hypothetical protein